MAGILTVYDITEVFQRGIKKKRVMTSSQCQTSSYQEAVFLPQSPNFIVSCSTEKQIQIQLWNWTKGQLVQLLDIGGLISVAGMFVFKGLEQILFIYGKPTPKNFPIKTV